MPRTKRKTKPVSDNTSTGYQDMNQTPYQNSEPTFLNRSSQPSNLLILLLIVVSFFAGYLFFKVRNLEQAKTAAPTAQTQQQQPAAPNVTLSQIKKLFGDGYMHFGDANKKVLFVEISDPSCPYCHIAGGLNSELSATSGQFKYVKDGGTYTPPLPEMRKLVDDGKASYVQLYATGHGNGRLGAQALYCAYSQDPKEFWAVHDKLLSNPGYTLLNNTVQNDKTKIPDLVNFLSGEIDSSYLTQCLQTGKYEQTLVRDEQIAQTMGFQGTPDFFVNTTNFSGAQDYKTIDPAVLAALK